MSKKPRFTKGVPEAVFQRELKKYLKRKEATPNGKNGKAAFTYKGVSYTFERGNGPFNSGYQLKTSSGQAAKEMARNEQKQAIKLSDGEKMFLDDKYAAVAERNVNEGRTGSRKLVIDHVEPRSKGGLHHPYNVRAMESGNNATKGAKQGGFGIFESLISDVDSQLQRGANFVKGNNAMSTVAGKVLDRVELGRDIFMQGQSGSELDQALNMIPDTSETDLGRHVGNGIANGIKNGFNEASYMTKEITNGRLPYNGDKAR